MIQHKFHGTRNMSREFYSQHKTQEWFIDDFKITRGRDVNRDTAITNFEATHTEIRII